MLAAEYDLEAASGVHHDDVTYRRGEYRVTARVDGERETASRWSVDGGAGSGRAWTSVVVAPTGRVAVRRPPFGEV